MRAIQIGAINVVLHPHSRSIYRDWFKALFRSRIRAPIYGNRYGAISQLYSGGDSDLHGVFSTFVYFDQTLPWFNEETYDDATDRDLGKVQLPDHLRPDHRRGHISLDAKRHLILFEVGSKKGVTPKQMLRFLERASADPRIMSKYGLPTLTVIPDSRDVEELLSWTKLKKLTIHTSLPNPDFADAAFSDIETWMQSQGAEDFQYTLGSKEPDLKPNSETKNLARVASEHGHVEAVGVGSSGRIVLRSTKSSKPMIQHEVYDEEVEPETNAFLRYASVLAAAIGRRRRAIGRVRPAPNAGESG